MNFTDEVLGSGEAFNAETNQNLDPRETVRVRTRKLSSSEALGHHCKHTKPRDTALQMCDGVRHRFEPIGGIGRRPFLHTSTQARADARAGWPVSPATFLSQARHPARTGCSKNTPMQQLAAESRGRGFARMARRYTVIIVIIIMVGDVSPRPGSCCVASLRCTLVHRLAAGSTCGRRGAADVAGRIYLCFPPRLPAWRWRGGQRCVRTKVVWCV